MELEFADLVIGAEYTYVKRSGVGHGYLTDGLRVKVVAVHPSVGPQPIEVEILEGNLAGTVVYMLFADCLKPV